MFVALSIFTMSDLHKTVFGLFMTTIERTAIS